MKKNKVLKFISILLFIIVFFLNFNTIVEASSSNFYKIVSSTEKLAEGGSKGTWKPDWNKFDNVKGGKTDKVATNIVGAVINIISVIGAGVAIVMLILLGVQYAASGVTQRAEIKKNAARYILGAVLIFAATGILKIVQKFVESNVNSI